MALTLLGNLAIGDVVPRVKTASQGNLAALQSQLAAIQSQLVAAQSLASQLQIQVVNTSSPGAFAPSIAAAQGALAAPSLAASLGQLSLGTLNAGAQSNLTSALSAVAALVSQIAGLNAQIGLLTAQLSLFASPGLYAYGFNGTVGGLSSDASATLGGGLPGGGGPGQVIVGGLVLLPSTPLVATAMGQVFRVS